MIKQHVVKPGLIECDILCIDNATDVEVVNHVNMALAARTAMWDIITDENAQWGRSLSHLSERGHGKATEDMLLWTSPRRQPLGSYCK